MQKTRFISFLFSICVIFSFAAAAAFSQENDLTKVKSREISDGEGIPVLVKHLPDWENAQHRASYILNPEDLRSALGERPVFDLIEFAGGTEAVTAPYGEAKLLLIEYTTPQASVDADNKINQRLSELGQNPPIFYRRIGNYNVFVFDTNDANAANALLDQINYQKQVLWLGEDPFLLQRAERAFITTYSQMFLATVFAIVSGFGFSIVAGLIVGIIFFQIRTRQRLTMDEYSDAGGMTRLNLDGLTPSILPQRLFKSPDDDK